MQTVPRTIAVVLLMGFAGLGSGCVAAAAGAGAGTAAYVTGDTETKVKASPKAVMRAARATFKTMEISVTDTAKIEKRLRIEGETSYGDSVKVTAEPRGGATKVWTRVSFFGDEGLSATLLQRIQQRL